MRDELAFTCFNLHLPRIYYFALICDNSPTFID